MKRQLIYIVIFLGVALIFASISSSAFVLRKGGNIYITDQKGERWYVTRAKTLGFRSEWFQYGIGRNAFTPLDDAYLSEGSSSSFQNPRVIGIVDGTLAPQDLFRRYPVEELEKETSEVADIEINKTL